MRTESYNTEYQTTQVKQRGQGGGAENPPVEKKPQETLNW